jgi:G3E family GTPase
MTNLIFIIGFLGSGKTTFINNVIKTQKNIGLIINDFGHINIDMHLVNQVNIPIIDIHYGSVFCDCKSESLLNGLKELSKHSLDTIYVESTGLANPKSLNELINLINKTTNHPIKHIGNIGIIDASNIHKVISTNLVYNQILLSDLILLNKCDLVNNRELNDIKQSILAINPTPDIIETVYANWLIDLSQFKKHQKEKRLDTESPIRLTIDITNKTLFEIEQLCEVIAPKCHRIKGYLTNEKTEYFEYSDHTFKVTEYPYQPSSVMTLLSLDQTNFFKQIKTAYHTLFEDEMTIITSTKL